MCSEWIAFTAGPTAIVAACAINLIGLSASVCHKPAKADTTEDIKTPSQIIVIEGQIFCNEKDVHAHVRTHSEETVSCTGTTVIWTYSDLGDSPNWPAQSL